jgi:hypothetical protein
MSIEKSSITIVVSGKTFSCAKLTSPYASHKSNDEREKERLLVGWFGKALTWSKQEKLTLCREHCLIDEPNEASLAIPHEICFKYFREKRKKRNGEE